MKKEVIPEIGGEKEDNIAQAVTAEFETSDDEEPTDEEKQTLRRGIRTPQSIRELC